MMIQTETLIGVSFNVKSVILFYKQLFLSLFLCPFFRFLECLICIKGKISLNFRTLVTFFSKDKIISLFLSSAVEIGLN